MDMMRAHQNVCGGGGGSRNTEDSKIAEEITINRYVDAYYVCYYSSLIRTPNKTVIFNKFSTHITICIKNKRS